MCVPYIWAHTQITLVFCDVGFSAASYFFQVGALDCSLHNQRCEHKISRTLAKSQAALSCLPFLHRVSTRPYHSAATKQRGEWGWRSSGSDRSAWTTQEGKPRSSLRKKPVQRRRKCHGTRHTAVSFRIHKRPHAPLAQQKTKCTGMEAYKRWLLLRTLSLGFNKTGFLSK